MTTFQTDTPITPLRQRMQQDMVMRGLGSHTQNDYVRHVRNFSAFLGRPPDTATAEDIRHYQLHQHETGVGTATINSTVSALRFLFTVTLNRRDLSRTLVITRNPRKLPEVLSVEEAARLLEAVPGIKYKAALGAAYGAGLRVSEVAHLKVDDIDSTRMLSRVEQGKGRKDRNAMLSPQLLELLRVWWREGRRRGVMLPHGWLFPGRSCTDPISSRQLHRAVQEAAEVPVFASASVRIHCGTALQPTSWRTVPISGSSRFCSDTASWRRRRSTPRSRPGRSTRSQGLSTG
ncbi:integrase/recombinase [Stappia aggregata IAM 12614]|uniref:Integrase/recombinase n=1 Tax=Roseibium aggregatum (strain ATCC 25650 / DSM 13394 / JCM 20685 / NBRC 16684 / NCIMB 2208 / IAM 12614 / B1) TaxID=384765 RepID=A0NYF4_ROSAI|nr:integrase/recombinase [Stappia aggregata IAM 12614] [Roseibium aggregatum IAM 12614]